MRAAVWSETIDLIVAEYERGAEQRQREEDWWRAEDKSFDELIERVGRADLFGKRHPHQRRLTASAIQGAVDALRSVRSRLETAPDFIHLWFHIQDVFGPVTGLGELAVYDAADRLRHRLDLESAHVIFLHSGARVGARRLAGGRLAKEEAWGIHRSGVPEGLRRLSTHEIEDILCIYKDEFLLTPRQFRAKRDGGFQNGCRRPGQVRPSC